jgi:hypothetical protein
MRIRGLVFALAALAALAGLGQPAAAQQVELRGRGDIEHDLFLRRLLESGDFLLISRDTLIAHNDTVPTTALVVGGRLRLDGTVLGDLVIVDANVFLRPSARVLGDVRNIGGGYYPSELATVAGRSRSEPLAPYIARELPDGTIIIQGLTRRAALTPTGIFGLAVPTYDRVDGLTLGYGAEYTPPRMGRFEPVLRGRVEYRSQRGAITGGGELALNRGATGIAVGAERTTLTNEAWIRSALDNSVSFFFTAKDYRDYYEADRFYAELRHTFTSGQRTTAAFLRPQVEVGRSLPAGNPWTVLGTPRDDNLAIDDGHITSLFGGIDADWRAPAHIVRLAASVEAAGRVLDGGHSFAGFNVSGDWAMAALANHTLRLQTHFRGPLPGTDSLPRQRWSFVGGSGTLYTFDFAQFRGDRVAFVETQYSIPLPLRVRFLGAPDLDLLHLAGMAWTAQERPPFEQNAGARLRFSLVNVRILFDPARFPDDFHLSAGLNLPRRRYPWQEDH